MGLFGEHRKVIARPKESPKEEKLAIHGPKVLRLLENGNTEDNKRAAKLLGFIGGTTRIFAMASKAPTMSAVHLMVAQKPILAESSAKKTGEMTPPQEEPLATMPIARAILSFKYSGGSQQ